MLREKHACEKHMAIFEKYFPNGIEITLDKCILAAQVGLDTEWAADELLSSKAYDIFSQEIDATALRIYSLAKAEQSKKYWGKINQANSDHVAGKISTRDYDLLFKQIGKDYKDAVQPARLKCMTECARAFFIAWKSDPHIKNNNEY
jgi:hypothetical protein